MAVQQPSDPSVAAKSYADDMSATTGCRRKAQLVSAGDRLMNTTSMRVNQVTRRLEKLLFLASEDSPHEAEFLRQYNSVWHHDKRFLYCHPIISCIRLVREFGFQFPSSFLQWFDDYQVLLADIRSSVQQRRLHTWRKSSGSSDASFSSKAFNWLSGSPRSGMELLMLPQDLSAPGKPL